MNTYCLQDFKSQFEKLKKNKSYRDLQPEIIKTFFGKESSEFLKHGIQLNDDLNMPFIKKRIGGRGGWRFYYLILSVKNNLYIMYVHPKKGSAGAENITEDFEKRIYREVLECIKSDDLYKITVENNKLIFTHNLSEKQDEESMEAIIREEVDLSSSDVEIKKENDSEN
jgi:hypothetical protein